MNKRNLAIFVPARLNSERLPNKQILPLGNSCMFEICCKKLSIITQIYKIPTYVLIYDQPLIDIAKKYPNIKIIIRDKKTCEVDGPLTFIFKDIQIIPEKYLMFLNPCLTLLSIDTIINNIKQFLNSDYEYGTSVKELKNWIFYKNNSITPIDYKRLTTKEIQDVYQCAHCFHIFNKKQFFKDGYMLKENHALLHIPEHETMDIDTQEEYNYAKYYWETICI